MSNYNVKLLLRTATGNMYRSSNLRSFFLRLSRLVSSQKSFPIYLRVSYGRSRDCFNRLVEFYNDGDYTNKKDLMHAFRAFVG